MRIVSFDPGGTTGWAMFDNEGHSVARFTSGQLGPQMHHQDLWDLLRELHHVNGAPGTWCEDFRIVSESFEFRNNNKDRERDNIELISREYIGVIRLYGAMHNLKHLAFQTAAQGKIRERQYKNKSGSFVQPRHLKNLGLWMDGTGHAMDAYGHLLYHVIHAGFPEYNDLRLYLLRKAWHEPVMSET
jgi:hypothetical protein